MGLYTCRQHFFNTKKFLKYPEVYKEVKANYKDYKNLHSQAAQQTLLKIQDDMISFFENLKLAKTEGRKVRLPKYKDKQGYYSVYLSKDCFKLTENKVRISISKSCKKETGLKFLYLSLPDLLQGKKIKQIEIIPRNNAKHFFVSYTYLDEKTYEKVEKSTEIRAASIDLGIDNLITMIDTVNSKALIVSGEEIKSINQYYNKKLAKLKSKAKKENNLVSTQRIQRLTITRNNKLQNRFHKIAKGVVEYCLKNNISEIIIGKNKQWKTKINIGKVNNQKFVQIPYCKLISYIKYRASRHEIKVIEQEESYTSKCDALSKEEICKQTNYLGSRIKRGLFKSAIGKILNADVNGAINILRKCKGDLINSWVESLASRGLVYRPQKLYFTGFGSLSL